MSTIPEQGLRVLLVGSGGREHALAWKLSASPLCRELWVAPGNPGMEGLPKTRLASSVAADAVDELVALARRERIGFVVCGPEVALAAGLGDAMQAAGIAFFGPTRAAAEVESSKAYAKRLMAEAKIPTAAFGVFEDVAAADRFIDAHPGATVVKADGLCAGKGVVVAEDAEEAKAAVRRALGDRAFGSAGARVVIEERLRGREISVMALCDGARLAFLATAEDHKAVGDGDTGPNTGGMGTYSPSPLLDAAGLADVRRRIFEPFVSALIAEGRPFRGVLYGGLILTADRGPMVIEWNARFGDPETQVVLARLEEDLLPWLYGAACGQLPEGDLAFDDGAAVCVVLAAHGYPGTPRAGDVIVGLDELAKRSELASRGELAPRDVLPSRDDVQVFHAGTRATDAGTVTAGGRVLGVTARGKTFAVARERAYAIIGQGPGKVGFEGMHFRRDIGLRGAS